MSSESPLAIPNQVEKTNRRFLRQRRGLIAEIIGAQPGLETADALRKITDTWLCDIWSLVLPDEFDDAVTLFATGGYGRNELAYHSDIDVLIGVNDPAVATDPDFVLAMERLMAWSRNTRIRLSHAVRTPDQARSALDDDLRTAIALVDLRHLAGPDVADGVFGRDHVVEYLRDGNEGRRFASCLIDRLRRRIARHGQTVYLLEPDVKHGEGGLRDLNAVAWAASVRWNIDIRRDAAPDVGWTDERRADYRHHLDELLALRNRLHLMHRRKHDRLNFHDQEALVRLADIADDLDAEEAISAAEKALEAAESPRDAARKKDELYPVLEASMRSFYRRARSIATTTERLLRRWASDDPPSQLSDGPFEIRGERLCIGDAAVDDELVFDALDVAGRNDLLLDPRLENRIEQRVATWRSGDDAPGELCRRLCALLVDLDQPDRTARRLVDLGILTRLVPEFEPLICHVQHDLYHVYTTDVHSRRCLEEGRSMIQADADDHPHPPFCRLASEIDDVVLFLLACLFHDIGKNRGGNHSKKGASVMGDVGPRLGLDEDETERLQFLVEHHLDLSTASRRRDISDPEIIDELAGRIETVECLNQLTALTYCDMTSVGPDVMNDWNASLLIELYGRLRAALTPTTEPSTDLRRRLAEHLDDDEGLDAFFDTVPADRLTNFDTPALARLFQTYHRALEADGGLAVETTPRPEKSATEVIISGPDHPGSLARIAGSIASVGLNIMSADITTTDDDRMLDVFFVAHFNPRAVPPAPPRPVDAPRRLERLETRICEVLADRIDVDEVLARRRDEQRLSPRPVPAVSTEIRVDTEASSRSTVVEVHAPDRLGLLYSIARTLHDCNVTTRLSRIDSVGSRAVDTFYLEEIDAAPLSGERIDAITARLREIIDTDE